MLHWGINCRHLRGNLAFERRSPPCRYKIIPRKASNIRSPKENYTVSGYDSLEVRIFEGMNFDREETAAEYHRGYF